MAKTLDLNEIKENALERMKKRQLESKNETNLNKGQTRIALRNCGIILPDDIEEYIALDGYSALLNVLREMTQEEVIEVVKAANLRGRGGAGFPAGVKWDTAFKQDSDQKYIICNGDEGDPGSFMDKTILEEDPHSIIEAMAIGAYAIGADQGYIYLRSEYSLAIERLEIALKQAREYRVLGKNILGTDFDFQVELKIGVGSFISGEATALIETLEGQRGMPRSRENRVEHKGLWQKPTIVNNVETLANIPIIFQKGVDWFNSIGTEKSSGTKILALSGKIKNAGLVEVPLGTTLREVIFNLGGGIPDGGQLKAIQIGGPNGGCVTAEHLDTPIDFEPIGDLGSMLGSGDMLIMDETTCMVDIAKFYLGFSVGESCGKCVPCREGTKRMYEMLERISEGQGTEADLDKLESLSETISSTSLCGLGQTASYPVTTTLKYFREEYEAHIEDKKCPAGSCEALLEYFIEDNCIGCTRCAKACPVSCIEGKLKERHVIDHEKCIKCGSCMEACPLKPKAVVKR